MGILAVTLLVVEAASLAYSIWLTRTITRSADDLYEATRQVAGGTSLIARRSEAAIS
jgi:hypothetical protein